MKIDVTKTCQMNYEHTVNKNMGWFNLKNEVNWLP